MFADLPKSLQNQILNYLETDNFKAAKQLHDDWISKKIQRDNLTFSQKKGMKQLILVSLVASYMEHLFQVLHPMILSF